MAKKTKKASTPVKKTAQDILGFMGISESGIMKIDETHYSIGLTFDDINFDKIDEEEQIRIYELYESILNAVGERGIFKITEFNEIMNDEYITSNFLFEEKNDEYKELRDEYNNVLISNIRQKSTGEKRHIITVSIEAASADEAETELNAIVKNIIETFDTINKSTQARVLTAWERLNYIYKMVNPDAQGDFVQKENFNLADIARQGVSVKDYICPGSFEFPSQDNNIFKINDEKYYQVVFIDDLPTSLAPTVLKNLSSASGAVVTTCTYEGIKNPAKLIKNAGININDEVMQAQKNAIRNNYSPELISSRLKDASAEIDMLKEDITERDQKLFVASILIMIAADSKEELTKKLREVISITEGKLCKVKKLPYQQREAFTDVLPIGTKTVNNDRLLTTESGAVFQPFSSKSFKAPHGIFYGQDQKSGDAIFIDRLDGINPSTVILGMPGAGKSFLAKKSMLSEFLAGNGVDIFVIDPEDEYRPLAEAIGGTVIDISPSSETKINPFDMDINFDDNPLAAKSDYIIGILEQMCGGNLPRSQSSIADRCVRKIYEDYFRKIQEANARKEKELKRTLNPEEEITILTEESPTLKTFYNLLKSQPEPEARNLALTIEQFCIGNMDTFAYKTSVALPKAENRFIVYNTKKIGSSMKELGVNIALNDMWNKVFENFKNGRKTYIYIDEFYLLLQTSAAARFLQMIWKRARKWKAVPTGMTQNVEDLLINPEGRTILSTSNFIFMLSQAPLDKAELSKLFSISPAEQQYITGAKSGSGLLVEQSNGVTLVPFADSFPKDTKIYSLLTTKVGERIITDATA